MRSVSRRNPAGNVVAAIAGVGSILLAIIVKTITTS